MPDMVRMREVATDPALSIGQTTIAAIASGGSEPTDPEYQRITKIEQFMALARRRFMVAAEAEAQTRQDQLEDLEFRYGGDKQWEQEAIEERREDGRPVITINRIPQFIRQVTNQIRAANLSIKVKPVDNGSDFETAEVLQGIIRNIESTSDAAVAYQTAADDQACMGRGFWRIVAEYDDENSFRQNLRIKRVRNQFSIYQDPASEEFDGSDSRFYFVCEDLPPEEFTRRFPEAQPASAEVFQSIGDQRKWWINEKTIRVAEYWLVDYVKVKKYLVVWPDGMETVIDEEKFQAIPPEFKPMATVRATRVADRRVVKMAIISGVEILEGNEDKTDGRAHPGKWIPIVPVIGDEIDLNGRVDRRGMVRDAKGPQRLYNIQNCALAETLAVGTKAPWIGFEGQFEGHEAKWEVANRRNFPFLEVKPITIAGTPAPFPQRNTAEPPIAAIVTAIGQANTDMQATMGLYQESLGQRASNTQSGKAIEALKQQGDVANSNFLDNLSRSLRFTGRVLIDLIPHYWDAPTVVRYLGDADEEKQALVHAGADPGDMVMPEGVNKVFDVSVGRYDVEVSAGTSASKRQAAVEALLQFVQAYPAAFPVVADILAKNMDWPGSQALAKRFAKLVPPQAMADEAASQLPPEIQAHIQQLTAALQEAQQMIEGRQLEQMAETERTQMEIASREKVTALQEQTKRFTVQAKIAADLASLRIEQEFDHLENRLGHAHDRAMSEGARAADRGDSNFERMTSRADADRQRQTEREDADRTTSIEDRRRKEDFREADKDRKNAVTLAKTKAKAKPAPKAKSAAKK